MSGGPSKSTYVDVDAIRKSTGRRGGVTIRGGRLPSNLGRGSIPTKKTVAPKIPQRRVRVKELPDHHENFQARVERAPKFTENSRGRGRGRLPKVYLQTEGSFLEQGPAMKLKKEYPEEYHERIPRSSSAKEKFDPDIKIDTALINELLNFYDEQAYCDTGNSINPVRLPLKKMGKCKKESIEIKQEVVDADDISLKIKKEPEESDCATYTTSLEGKFFTKIEHKTADVRERSLRDDLKMSHGEDMLVLLQLPSCMPFRKPDDIMNESKDSGISIDENESKETNKGVNLQDISDGRLGKLQFLKSGVVCLKFGNICMEVEKAIHSETLADVVSISTDGSDVSIIELGRVERKVILSPILQDIIECQHKESYKFTEY